jgi:hypothetical protein
MDWLTFVATIIKAIVWPGTVLALVWKFREPLSDLVKRIIRVSMGGNSIDLQLSQTRVLANMLQPKEIQVSLPEDESEGLAVIDPRAAISEAWLQVEEALNRAAERHQLPKELRQPGRIAGSLFMRGKIGAGTYEVFKSLRELRNLVEHQPTAEEITTTRALV